MPGKKNDNDQENVLQDDFLDTPMEGEEDWMEATEGALAVDVYQTKENVVIKAPIAGVSPDNIDIEVAEDVVTIRGERIEDREVDREHYYVQECYWGAFSRSVILPTSTIAEKAA